MQYKILFFGSFQHYSVRVLEKLLDHFEIVGVVTTPPKPAGRHLKLTPTEVEVYAKSKNLPVSYEPQLKTYAPIPDFIVVAGYGKLIPNSTLDLPKIMPVNMHPSLLPQYPGPMPGEWAILNGEKISGVTLIKMSPRFDDGEILIQSSLEILPTDTRITFYERAFSLGADMLVDCLPKITNGEITPRPQPKIDHVIHARKLTRQDGFMTYEEFMSEIEQLKNCLKIENCKLKIVQMHRAFAGWPGVWTLDPSGKRIKLLQISPIKTSVSS